MPALCLIAGLLFFRIRGHTAISRNAEPAAFLFCIILYNRFLCLYYMNCHLSPYFSINMFILSVTMLSPDTDASIKQCSRFNRVFRYCFCRLAVKSKLCLHRHWILPQFFLFHTNRTCSSPFGFYQFNLVYKFGCKGINFPQKLQYFKIGKFSKKGMYTILNNW